MRSDRPLSEYSENASQSGRVPQDQTFFFMLKLWWPTFLTASISTRLIIMLKLWWPTFLTASISTRLIINYVKVMVAYLFYGEYQH